MVYIHGFHGTCLFWFFTQDPVFFDAKKGVVNGKT